MAIDRTEARRRVRTITAWAAGGAAVLTAAFAFGASRGGNVAKAPGRSGSGSPDAAAQDAPPQSAEPQGVYPRDPQAGQGFAPPSASTGPPAGMSGGS
jgi:hypothetical protein